jgi:putative ABC transport system permease protein
MLVPLSYNLRSLFVRRSSTLLTVVGIGATVAIVSGVIALITGFRSMFTAGGRDDVAVFLRPGANNEGDSQFSRERGLKLIKSVPEIRIGESGPVAAMEAYLAVLLPPVRGGVTNVPLRGVQPMTFEIRRNELSIVQGKNFTPGSNELIVGRRLVDRVQNCHLDGVIVLNKTPFRVVGVFDHPGQFAGEIWGDLDRLVTAMGRYGPNRVIAELQPGTDIGAPDPKEVMFNDDPPAPKEGSLAARLLTDTEVPAKVYSETQFLASQTVMPAIASRTHEIGVLLSMGYRPVPIFLSFLFEALVLGLLGGLAGCVLALPFNGVRAGTMNFQTFTEMSFAFRVTPVVLAIAITFSLVLGLLGGALPAWRAARLKPTEALRQA